MCIRDSGDVADCEDDAAAQRHGRGRGWGKKRELLDNPYLCLLYTSDAADERSSVDLGGRRIIKKKNRGKL